MSHLYFYQVTYHPLADVPHWLNEGVAQYNEYADKSSNLENAKDVIGEGGLIPLWSLTGSFGYNEDKFRFAYDEAISATVYIVEIYGERGMSRLLAAFKAGLSGNEAFKSVFGRNILEFQEDWLVWMGVSPKIYPTPTKRPALFFATAPSYSATPGESSGSDPRGDAGVNKTEGFSKLFCIPFGLVFMAGLIFLLVWIPKRGAGA
ncbi:MAG: peptidase MA family metallohydrolase [Chloroflexota bacterium]